ncbi:MAG: hypothetical protein QOH79_1950, partial [Acidimicrobiaceae bacterium]
MFFVHFAPRCTGCARPCFEKPGGHRIPAVPSVPVGAHGELERERELRRRGQQTDEQRDSSEAIGPQSVLDLQRSAGNQAVSAMLRELSPQTKPAAGGLEVSPDQSAEREADKVADATVGRLGRDATQAPILNGTLSPTLRRALGAVAP